MQTHSDHSIAGIFFHMLVSWTSTKSGSLQHNDSLYYAPTCMHASMHMHLSTLKLRTLYLFARSPAHSPVRSPVRSPERSPVRSPVRSYVRPFARMFARAFGRAPPRAHLRVRTYNPRRTIRPEMP